MSATGTGLLTSLCLDEVKVRNAKLEAAPTSLALSEASVASRKLPWVKSR